MLTWWTNMESLAALNTWMLAATMVFAVLTGIMVFLTIGKSKRLIDQFSEDAQNYRKQVKSLEKTAEGIRKELLQTQQHQDINQLKLKTSNSSAQELRQSLLDAQEKAGDCRGRHQNP
jgi:septal ring factor EnvC (AmiA/AmiB activator)